MWFIGRHHRLSHETRGVELPSFAHMSHFLWSPGRYRRQEPHLAGKVLENRSARNRKHHGSPQCPTAYCSGVYPGYPDALKPRVPKTLGSVFWMLKSTLAFPPAPPDLYLSSGNLCEEIRRPLCYSQQPSTSLFHFEESSLWTLGT